MRVINSCLIIAALLVFVRTPSIAASIVHTQDLEPLVLSKDDVSNNSSFGGPAGSSKIVFITSYVVTAWANAGVEVNWLARRNWNNTFATSSSSAELPAQSGDITLATNEAQAAQPEIIGAQESSANNGVAVDPALLFRPQDRTNNSSGSHLDSSAFAISDRDYVPVDPQEYWQLVAAVFTPEPGDSLGLPRSDRSDGFGQPTCWPSAKDSIAGAECKGNDMNIEDEDQSLAVDILPEPIAIAVLAWDRPENLKLKTFGLIGLAAPILLLARRRRTTRPTVYRTMPRRTRRELVGKCA